MRTRIRRAHIARRCCSKTIRLKGEQTSARIFIALREVSDKPEAQAAAASISAMVRQSN